MFENIYNQVVEGLMPLASKTKNGLFYANNKFICYGLTENRKFIRLGFDILLHCMLTTVRAENMAHLFILSSAKGTAKGIVNGNIYIMSPKVGLVRSARTIMSKGKRYVEIELDSLVTTYGDNVVISNLLLTHQIEVTVHDTKCVADEEKNCVIKYL